MRVIEGSHFTKWKTPPSVTLVSLINVFDCLSSQDYLHTSEVGWLWNGDERIVLTHVHQGQDLYGEMLFLAGILCTSDKTHKVRQVAALSREEELLCFSIPRTLSPFSLLLECLYYRGILLFNFNTPPPPFNLSRKVRWLLPISL